MHTYALLAVAIPAFILGPVLALVLPALVGVVTSVVYENVKKAQAWVNGPNMPPQAHAFLVGAISVVFPLLAKAVGLDGTTDFFGMDQTAVQTVVMFGATQLTHLLTAKK